MKRFRNILIVPIAKGVEPPPGLFEAVELAEKSGAALTMRSHVEGPSDVLLGDRHSDLLSSLHERARGTLLDRMAGWVAQTGHPTIEIDVIDGSLPVGVARAVDDADHDLVIVATDGTGIATTAARRIVDACHCPVWLLRPGFRGASVLAAVDPSHSATQNRRILELARSQAELHGGQMRVLHAWELFGRDLWSGAAVGDLEPEQLGVFIEEVESAHREWMAALAGSVGLPADTPMHLIDGNPVQAIEGLSVLYRVDLVVLGAGRTRSDRLGLGSTTDCALADLRYSTLTVSPLE